MKSRTIIWSILILLLIITSSCLERQRNQVTAPVTPTYTLSGHVTDIDDKSSLANIKVSISPLINTFDPGFQNKTTQTDESGQFRFSDLVVGVYSIQFERDNFVVLQDGYWQDYGDSTISYELTSPYQLEFIFEQINSAKFSIFNNTIENKSTGLVLSNPVNPAQKNLMIFEINNPYWNISNEFNLPFQIIDLAFMNISFGKSVNEFYVSYDDRNTVYKFLMDTNTITITDSISSINGNWDVFCYQDELYVSYFNNISVYNEITLDFDRTLTISDSTIWITSLIRDEQYFWISDVNQSRLYQCDLNLNVLNTFTPILNDQAVFIRDMSFDIDKNFWVVF